MQSHKEEIDATEAIFREHIKNITNVSELDHIKFLPIKDSERLEKLYSEVLISSTSELFQKHNLISNEDMQKKLASMGKTMNFNELPNYFYMQSMSEKNLDLNVMHEYYSSAYNLLDETIEENVETIMTESITKKEKEKTKENLAIVPVKSIPKQPVVSEKPVATSPEVFQSRWTRWIKSLAVSVSASGRLTILTPCVRLTVAP